MIISKTLRATSGCSNCRTVLLRTFICFADLPRQTVIPPPWKAFAPISKHFRYFSTDTAAAIDRKTPISSPNDASTETAIDHQDGTGDITVSTETEAKETVPWYLQVETTKKTPEFLLERQRIPDLPDNPPKILELLLHQLSIDLGLDYLTILDLRKLNPPAALGSNLLMIISTARSEKHLHSSADRLCRWLRSNYKLRPDADGLLGRDERKLKMRRKVRRAKLLGNGLTDDSGDDGIRTGWICVNIGTVEKGPTPESTGPVADNNFTGFGQRFDGVKIVVQMLTEEKRQDIDLESLWDGVLRRAEKPELQDDMPEDK